jgi:molecular chaperone GrpE
MSEAERASPLGRGVALTQVVFLEKLKSFGVERIEAEGRPFDPAWHEAMRETERSDVAPGTVLNEWTRGYRLGSKLVRAAKVEVARAPAEGDASMDEE